jgi:hypothetical protein
MIRPECADAAELAPVAGRAVVACRDYSAAAERLVKATRRSVRSGDAGKHAQHSQERHHP